MDMHLTQLLEMLGSATMSFVTQDRSEGCQPLHSCLSVAHIEQILTTVTFNNSFFFFSGTVVTSVPYVMA